MQGQATAEIFLARSLSFSLFGSLSVRDLSEVPDMSVDTQKILSPPPPPPEIALCVSRPATEI